MNEDIALLEACLEGDEQAWKRLQKLVEAILLEVGYFHSSHVHAPPDILQETMVVLINQDMRALRQFRGRGSLRAYLRTIVRRVLARLVKKESSIQSGYISDVAPPLEPQAGNDFQEQVVNRILVYHLLDTMINSLDKHILYLDSLGYSSKEIADLLSRLEHRPISPELVRQRKVRALRYLRKKLSHQ